MKRRMLFVLLALFMIAAPVLAEDPVVTDSALVLSDQTSRDIATLNRRLQDAAGVSIAVVTRHFLDGAQPQAQAEAMLRDREDGRNTILLLLVIGEERFAVAVGGDARRLLPAEAVASLASMRLTQPFNDRAYDQAVGAFLTGVAAQIGSAAGESIDTHDLFGATAAPTVQPQGVPRTEIEDWLERIRPQRERDTEGVSDTSISIGRVVFILAALYFIFGRNARKGRRGGCSSLIWVLIIFSIAGGFDFLR